MMEQESERGVQDTQHVENIIIHPAGDSNSSSAAVDSGEPMAYDEKSRGTYAKATMQRYKWFIAGGILIVILIISVVLGVTLSGSSNSSAQISNNNNGGGGLFDGGGSGGSGGSGGTGTFPDDYGYGENSNGNGGGIGGIGGTGTIGTGSMPGGVEGPESFLTLLENSFNSLGFPDRHFSNFNEGSDTPQLSALQWVTESDDFGSLRDINKLQRYALATFFYATYAMTHPYMTSELPWKSEDNWLSEEHECEWEGVLCSADDGNTVIGIELNDHRVSGSLPMDLGLLGPTLTKLHLAANFVYMDGPDLDVFAYLTSLEDLKMDDNYIVARAGLPSSLQNLANLKKVVLSYNLLQGTIPTNYFSNMRQLSHLEVESNYIAGSLPHSLITLESLVYLYIRRNSLDFSFAHLLQQVRWPNIFSLWFDNNNITGVIPTEIGLLTGLASLSITNSSLVGTIPTEIGHLTGLRRAWFYSNNLSGPIPEQLDNLKILEVLEIHTNELTGVMPPGVCSTISKSTYRFKELSTDCSKVACDNCCTKCF